MALAISSNKHHTHKHTHTHLQSRDARQPEGGAASCGMLPCASESPLVPCASESPLVRGEIRILAPHRRTYILSHPHPHTRKHTQTPTPPHIVTIVDFNIITLCRSASLYCCARFLVPPIRSTCLRSANLYWCALIETTLVSASYVSQQFCIGVPLLRLQSYHHQYTSHNHTTILYGRSL